MAASLVAPPTSQISSPLVTRHALTLPTSFSRTEEVRKKRCERTRNYMRTADHGHSAKRENYRSSAFERVESGTNSTYPTPGLVPSGCVDSTIRRSLPSPAHHSANELTHSANECGNLQALSSGAPRYRGACSVGGGEPSHFEMMKGMQFI